VLSEEKEAGIFEVTWYVTNLPSRVDFYKPVAKDFVRTKK
jgi:hypothetical protein